MVGEDSKTIIHHKVTARVSSLLSEPDALVVAQAEQRQQHQHHAQYDAQHGASN